MALLSCTIERGKTREQDEREISFVIAQVVFDEISFIIVEMKSSRLAIKIFD
jgi:hypothetical protein